MNIDVQLFEYKNYLISKILDSSTEEGINIFLENIEILQDVNFIISNPYKDGNNYMDKFRRLVLNDIEVNYFFGSEWL